MDKEDRRDDDQLLMLYDAIADNIQKMHEQVQRLDRHQKQLLAVNAKICVTTTQFHQIFRNLSILNRSPT